MVSIKNAKAFDFYEKTFFFIASSFDNNDYALEVFVDFKKEEFYFNR